MLVKTYSQKLTERIESVNSNLCVGLDPRVDQIDGDFETFVLNLIDETISSAACYKPNAAYFEALGSKGYAIMERIITHIPEEIPVILDAKRGDIGATQSYYAKAYFEMMDGVDAVTISPYMGFDSVEPMLKYPGKAVYLLGVTSKKTAQDIETQILSDGRSVFELVCDMSGKDAEHDGEIGFVLGLTNAESDIINKFPDAPLLLPGLGAQGGDLSQLNGANRKAPLVINVSRGVMFGEGTVSQRALKYKEQIAEALGA